MKKLHIALLFPALFAAAVIVYWSSKPNGLPEVTESPVAVNGSLPQSENSDTAERGSKSDKSAPNVAASPRDRSVQSKSQVAARRREQRVADFVVDADGIRHPVRTYKTSALPNDPSANQWWVGTTGVEPLWSMGQGSYQTTLAVIDTGFALKHEEFSGRLYVNSGETGSTAQQNPSILNCSDRGLTLDEACNVIDDDFDGVVDNESGATVFENNSLLNCSDQGKAIDKSCNLIDDDGNGLIDDVSGFDFVNFDRSAQAGETNPNGDGTTHGTAVMGVAAASGNNARGIAGIDWYSKLLPLQALDDDSYGNTISVGRAIRYAADQGADVISISLGTVGPDSFVREAVAYALSKGSLVVAASGNDGCECLLYPAGYDEVIAVGASNTTDQRASFSNYGAGLDVIAPGTSMTSAYWTAANGTSSYASGLAGTSFSTPYVAGMLSLMKSHKPSAHAHQLIGALTETTNKLTLTSSQNHSSYLGYGRVSADSVANRLQATNSPAIRYAFGRVSNGGYLAAYEPESNGVVYQCESERPGTTRLYRMSKGAQVFYTISQVERYRAISQGFTSELWSSRLCIDLPTDQPAIQRMLSIAQEFEDRADKN